MGFVIWLTGLPCSGKTTLGEALAVALGEHGITPEILDGEVLRRSQSADLGFSAEDRKEHARRVIALSKRLLGEGGVVLVPLVSPYRQTRDFARSELGRFVEVHVKCPVEECIRRDVKGMYAKAIRGEIAQFTGISDPYEEPEHPEVTVETDTLSVDQCCQRIMDNVYRAGYINSADRARLPGTE